MNVAEMIDQSLLRRAVVEVAGLPDDDLAIVLDIVALLKQQKTTDAVADIRIAARQRATTLRAMSRDQLATQYREIGEKIRGQAIAEGTAIEENWEGD